MNFTKILYISTIIILLTGCSTNEKFLVQAPTGTKIYTPDNINTPASTITSSDNAKIVVPSDMYCGYILAQSPGSDIKIPIGLDYKYSTHTGTKVGFYTGCVLVSIGLGATVIGGGAMLAASCSGDSDSSDSFGLVTAAGAGLTGVAAAIGGPTSARLCQTAYDYNFSYEDNQRIKTPELSSVLLNPNPSKTYKLEEKKNYTSRSKASSGNNNQPNKSKSSYSSNANRSRSDNARKVEGEYIGDGKLLSGRDIEETYSTIKIILKRIDKSRVSVRIIESDEDYFDGPLVYNIQNGKNGSFVLRLEKLPEATILITKNGQLTFNHGKVNIENTLYKLEITANKTRKN